MVCFKEERLRRRMSRRKRKNRSCESECKEKEGEGEKCYYVLKRIDLEERLRRGRRRRKRKRIKDVAVVFGINCKEEEKTLLGVKEERLKRKS